MRENYKNESKYYSLRTEDARKFENIKIVIGARGCGKQMYENARKMKEVKQNENA